MMTSPTEDLVLVARGSEGIRFIQNAPFEKSRTSSTKDERKTCKAMAFSKDGSLFSWCNTECVTVVDKASVIAEIPKPRTHFLHFSPNNNILATWETYAVTKDNPQGSPNLNLWDMKSGNLLRGFVQKRHQGWCPQWSSDEEICSRNVNNEIQFFEKNNFQTITTKLHLQKLSEFSLSPNSGGPYRVAVYVPGVKGAPAFVRMFQYPNFDGPHAAIANKSFFKSERINMYWNGLGTALLVLTSTESSDSTYYGEQGLHFLATNGDSSLVPLAKNGPIYSVQWNPNTALNEFLVVYGYMPAKATIYNVKTEPLFDFGTGPRNAAYFNAFGNILCLAGFGNLRGNMEFWDMKQKKKISNPMADDITYFEWCPDGEHIVTATTAPRLRVSNGYKIWHYTGVVVHQELTPKSHELWEMLWQPVNQGTYTEKPISYKPIQAPAGLHVEQPAPKAAVYRPPGAKGMPSTFKVHEEAEGAGKHAGPGDKAENMSKAALKNKKKREAKKAKQDQSETNQAEPQMAVQPSALTNDPETDKKIRSIQKKLQAIEKLKTQQQEGKKLEKNQLDKIDTEQQLLQELDALNI